MLKSRSLQRTLPLVVAGLLCPLSVALAVPSQLVNAASVRYGARASVAMGTGVRKDADTTPQTLLDDQANSRLVMIGAPYTITLTLPFKVRVERLSLRQSSYAKEAAPKDVEISFDGGAPVTKTLEATRPSRTNQAWQDVEVGREIQSVTIKVLTNIPGEVAWGGIGDVALWTSTDLDAQLRVPGYDAAAPAFVHAALPVAANTPIKVSLPPVAKEGEHPRLLFTPAELADFRAQLPKSARGKATLDSFLQVANGALASAISFPTPEDTAANKADAQHEKLSKSAGALGMAYLLTNDAQYAKVARELLLGYAERYESYPRHSGRNKNDSAKISFQRLSEAMWLIPLIESYDSIYNSGVLSEEDRKQIETGLVRPAILEIRREEPAEEVAKRDKKNADWRTATPEPAQQGNYPNWINYYSAATMMAGAVMNDRDMMDLAAADFRDAIARGIGADGMWGEGAINYQLFAMGVMVPGFEAAARNGYDLWSSSNGRFKMLFDSPLRYAYPDGTLPGINDSARGQLGSWQTMVYDYGFLRYGDPTYAHLINTSPRQLHQSPAVYEPTRLYDSLPEPPSIQVGSTLFGSLGYAILRDSTKYALMDYGPHGGVHGHPDKLNLLLFASAPGGAGDEMGGEPQFHFYDSPLHPQWTTQTVAHNTMTVDEQSQLPSEGKLLVYEDTPTLKLMRAESVSSYPGVVLDRTVLTLPDAVVDLFSARGTTPHVWDRTFRFAGKLAGLPAIGADAKPLGNSDGYQHFLVAGQQDARSGWNGVWTNPTGQFSVTVAGAPQQQVILGTGPDKEEMALIRQNGTSANVGAAYALDSWKNPVQSARWLSPNGAPDNGVRVFEMVQRDGTTTRIVVMHSPGEWQAAGWKSDARVLCVRQKGDQMQLLLAGGTFAQNGALQVRQQQAGNLLAEKRGARLQIVSSWSPSQVAPPSTR